MLHSDYTLLLETADSSWRVCLDAYSLLAMMIAGGAQFPESQIASIRADLDRTLSDLMSICEFPRSFEDSRC